jgi:putative SOS response-associated peptidase YedK
MIRKMAARMGLPNRTRNSCSNMSPASPTGIVATMISQASRWSAVCSCHRLVPSAGWMTWRIEAKNPLMIRTQSRQK